MEPTRVMTLGRLGALSPSWRTDFMQQPRITPAGPVNPLRQTMTSGIRRTMGMLGALGDLIENPLDAVPNPPATPGPLAVQSVVGPAATVTSQNPVQSTMTLPVGGGMTAQQVADAAARVGRPSMGRLALILSLSTLSGVISAYHGYHRDRGSWGSAFGWFTLGSMFPLITPIVAVAAKPGFAKPRRGSR